MTNLGETPRKSLIERGLAWDTHFNRRLGAIAAIAAGGIALAGFPVAAGWTAAFAAGNLATAEVEQRISRTFEKRRLGKEALKTA